MIKILIFFLLIIWLMFFSKKTILKKIMYLLLIIIAFPFAMCTIYHKEDIIELSDKHKVVEIENIELVILRYNYVNFILNKDNLNNLILKEIKIYHDNNIIKTLDLDLKFSEMEMEKIEKSENENTSFKYEIYYYFEKELMNDLYEIYLKNIEKKDEFSFEITIKNLKNNEEYIILFEGVNIFFTSKGFELFIPNI